jgi:POT family proton-dependent oligopeptide transporter
MKWAAVAMCFIELAERASWYGCVSRSCSRTNRADRQTKIWNNYMKNPLPVGGNGAGAVAQGAAGLNQVTGGLGMGSVSASAVTSAFNFLTYTM